MPGSAAAGLPLSTLLSHALVAFTIEFDNEFERQMPHRTTRGSTAGSRQGPWLVSLAMYSNCMRFVSDEGITARELERMAHTSTNWHGMQRWGYITVQPDPADRRPKPPRSDWIVRATLRGRKAQQVWGPLFDDIEKRWRARFGEDRIERLRESLSAVISQIDLELPDCLPILGYGLFSKAPDQTKRAPAAFGDTSSLSLPALLSRVLLAFAIEFETESELSLAISANILRVLDEKGVLVRDLPRLAGVSKEAIRMAAGILRKSGVAVEEPDQTGGRAKVMRLTPNGRTVRDHYRQLLVVMEERWQARFGKKTILQLKESLQELAGQFLGGIEPYPDGWRAAVRKPDTLPHYPMVLHRGGFPDGS